ncbi:MAG: recombinase [Kiritimatiellia bacterium]|jgi:ribonucleoside-triphosphate reductase
MSIEALQDYVFTSKYSRYLPQKNRRETYEEAVDRVIDMHRRHFQAKGIDVEDLLAEVREGMRQRLMLGSQRAMQFGGDPILKKNARMYNCTTSYCDRPRFFQESLWLLLCGAGVGFSVQTHHIAKLPKIARPHGEEVVFKIPDTIEGWADSLGVLLSAYFVEGQPFPEYAGKFVTFDYSLVRPKGAPISSGMGRAPGPEPLKRSLEVIRQLLDKLTDAPEPVQMRSIDAYDILMHASDAVLSGGVRRSACICLFSPDDELMATAKTGNWFIENPQRARSNNSAMLLRDGTTREQFARLMKSVKEFGEPGFVWTDDLEATFNPCVEIGLYPQIDGVSGFAFCNLCEINMGKATTPEKFMNAARLAAILGTLQADYTRFDYLGPVSERIARREALLGVSMTGMMEHPAIAFDPELQRQAARVILETNEAVAARIGINPCARATCVKPAGSTSCILGTSSGIHPHHARRYFRRAQANEDELMVEFYRAQNPLSVEKSVWNPNGTDVSLIFCIEPGPDAITKNDIDAIELLEHVKVTKNNWIDAGKVPERCARPWLSHNVSNTINVRDSEWDVVEQYIYDNRDAFAGISLLPDGGDLDYPQAPFCSVPTTAELIEHYGDGAMYASGIIEQAIEAFDGNLWTACDAILGRAAADFSQSPEIPAGTSAKVARAMIDEFAAKHAWMERARKFAANYFGGDLLKMTRCLKRVNNCKLWDDIHRTNTRVDYMFMEEFQDNTTLTQTVACGGGKCDIL